MWRLLQWCQEPESSWRHEDSAAFSPQGTTNSRTQLRARQGNSALPIKLPWQAVDLNVSLSIMALAYGTSSHELPVLHQAALDCMKKPSAMQATTEYAEALCRQAENSPCAAMLALDDQRLVLHTCDGIPPNQDTWMRSVQQQCPRLKQAALIAGTSLIIDCRENLDPEAALWFPRKPLPDTNAWLIFPLYSWSNQSEFIEQVGTKALLPWQIISAAWSRIERAAGWDPGTGARSRSALDRNLSAEMERAQRYRYPISLVVLDVDHFKSVNDRFGHPAGDHCLREIAQQVSQLTRTSDGLYRYGGDEFCILLPHTGADGANTLSQRIRSRMKSLTFHPPVIQTVSVSIGFATWLPSDKPITGASLLETADQAMYREKSTESNPL